MKIQCTFFQLVLPLTNVPLKTGNRMAEMNSLWYSISCQVYVYTLRNRFASVKFPGIKLQMIS